MTASSIYIQLKRSIKWAISGTALPQHQHHHRIIIPRIHQTRIHQATEEAQSNYWPVKAHSLHKLRRFSRRNTVKEKERSCTGLNPSGLVSPAKSSSTWTLRNNNNCSEFLAWFQAIHSLPPIHLRVPPLLLNTTHLSVFFFSLSRSRYVCCSLSVSISRFLVNLYSASNFSDNSTRSRVASCSGMSLMNSPFLKPSE